jgi:hypothetical protein
MELKEIMDDIRDRPTVPLWPHVAKALGISRWSVYEAVKRRESTCSKSGPASWLSPRPCAASWAWVRLREAWSSEMLRPRLRRDPQTEAGNLSSLSGSSRSQIQHDRDGGNTSRDICTLAGRAPSSRRC